MRKYHFACPLLKLHSAWQQTKLCCAPLRERGGERVPGAKMRNKWKNKSKKKKMKCTREREESVGGSQKGDKRETRCRRDVEPVEPCADG